MRKYIQLDVKGNIKYWDSISVKCNLNIRVFLLCAVEYTNTFDVFIDQVQVF